MWRLVAPTIAIAITAGGAWGFQPAGPPARPGPNWLVQVQDGATLRKQQAKQAEARRRAAERRGKAKKTAERFGELRENFRETRGGVKQLGLRLKSPDVSVHDISEPALRREIDTLQAQGGDFFVEQAELFGASTALAAQGLPENDRPKLQARRDAAAKRLRSIDAEARDVLAGLQAIDIAERGGQLDRKMKVTRRFLKNRLEKLGGRIEVDAYLAESEQAKLAEEIGLVEQSPMYEGYVPLEVAVDVEAGKIASQGKDPVCGIAAAAGAARARGCLKGFDELVSELQGSEALKVGTERSELAAIIRRNLRHRATEQTYEPGGGATASARLAIDLADPARGPFVVGVTGRSTRSLGTSPEEVERYLPEGIGPALSRAGRQALGVSGYVHWITVDGVVTVDSGAGKEPHFIVRDSQVGHVYLYSVADFDAVFDGQAIEVGGPLTN